MVRDCEMKQSVDHDELDAELRRCGSNWSAAQAHGLLCGCLAVAGEQGIAVWRGQVIEADAQPDVEFDALLGRLAEATWHQLAERLSEFEVVLPDDDEDASLRAQALSDWAEGFLHGLVTHAVEGAVRTRLGEEPLSDLIPDLLEITRASVGEDDTSEETELAYTELVEYIRVAAQLAYEQLADARSEGGASAETLH